MDNLSVELKLWLISKSLLGLCIYPMWGRILLRTLTLICSQYALPLSLQKLERVHPMSPSRPVISHKHMLRPNVHLSRQLTGDRSIKDSCDSGGQEPEIMWRQSPNCASVTEEHWEVCHLLITTKVLAVLKWVQRIRLTELHNSCAQEAFSGPCVR